MESLSRQIMTENNFPNLKEVEKSEAREEIVQLLADGEEIVSVFQTVRDQVIFTNKRVITANIQAVTGVKKSFYSYPYSRIQYYGIETAGVLDIDSELVLGFNDGIRLAFDFSFKINIEKICSLISKYIL